jgi:polysaccharide biosynthesis transport protein
MTLLRRHGLWLVLAMIAGITGAYLLYSGQSTSYSSSAQVDVESHVVAMTTPVQPNMTTETQVATSGVVVTSTAHAVGMSTGSLQPHLSAKVSGTANIMSITCTMPTPVAAQRCAAAAARAYIDFRNLSSGSANAQAHDPLNATLVTSAPLPATPAGLGKKILLPIGALLGLLLGLGGVILRDRFDDRVRDRADLESCLDAPVVAEVPRVSRRAGPPASVFARAPQSRAAEAYRYLRARLDPHPLVASTEGGTVLLVVGARGLEGRTSVAANLATVFAHIGDRVILVDADLKRPSLSKVFGTGPRPGLSELLAGRASLEEVAVPTDVPGLRLVTAGETTGQTSDTLEVSALDLNFARMKVVADVIIIDCAPVLEVSDALTLARVSELVVVVADLRRTRRGDATAVAQQIRAVGLGTIVGVINGARRAPWNRSLRPAATRYHVAPEPERAATASNVPAIMAGLVPPRGPNGKGGTHPTRPSRRVRPDVGRGGENNPRSGHEPEAEE